MTLGVTKEPYPQLPSGIPGGETEILAVLGTRPAPLCLIRPDGTAENIKIVQDPFFRKTGGFFLLQV
jgi:hypothetical protein